MKDRAYRCLPVAIVIFVLLILPGLAAAEEGPAARGEAASEAVDRAGVRLCTACDIAHQRCSANCFGLADRPEFVGCMMGCDNAAINCTCDEEVTLRSEDILPMQVLLGANAVACHGNVSCQPGYPSCASWTSYYDCGDPFCGFYRWCPEDCPEEFGCFGEALRQRRESYRVCFNEFGQSCTEYQAGSNYILGCGC